MLKEIEGADWGRAFEYAGERTPGIDPYVEGEYPYMACDPGLPEHELEQPGFTRNDVARIVAISDGVPESDSWVGVFQLHDGRYAAVSAGCSYSGWDVQGGGQSFVALRLGDLIRWGLTMGERERLGLSLTPSDESER